MTASPPSPFPETAISEGESLSGPWRAPRQMLADQSYDHHSSIHDDATAQRLGFKGGTIEGPTHFSQFAPLAVAAWGPRWLDVGCISAHYRAPVYEGEEVRAHMARVVPGQRIAEIWMEKADGTEVLRGTCSVGPDHPESALDRRLAELPALEQPVILEDVVIGTKTPRRRVAVGFDQHMGDLYPFTLRQKLGVITEASPYYAEESAGASPHSRAIIPVEMISVLLNHAWGGESFYRRGPVVGLFADQEIRLHDGPLFVGESYEIEREAIALTGSRRTESLWIRTRVYRPGEDRLLATMLLNQAIMKDSFAGYEEEHARLYRVDGRDAL
ncbi:hypothetical protein [Sphingopyxis sp.]|uniref:hypothetical protein n=1 Tax=Sphingopyxis sp. TaxID=1908224 RepID=UPI0026036B05|nr:hypothetical protein [Sphingopyxis sp.]MCW0199438.1 hypothetical protein [Sphingopyxis sp.]